MRPIDADKLKWDFNVYIPAGVPQNFVDTICNMVDAQPTIEAEPNSCEYWDSESHFCALRRPQAEPVKHGKWMWLDGVRCSICNYKLQNTGLPTYCPNCGATMDEVEE